jgi:hypothetical protein
MAQAILPEAWRPTMRQSLLPALALAAAALSGLPAPAADTAGDEYIFKLASGGEVRGKFLNVDERPRTRFVIQTASGGKLALDKDDVAEFVRKPARELEYERLRPTYPDTVEGQLALAQWCKENQLPQARKAHLQRVIQLDPNHAEARRALDHRLVEGKWMTYEQYMHDVVGKVKLPGGAWVTQQELDLRSQRQTQKVAEQGEFRNVQRLVGLLDARDERQRTTARDDLLKIRNPHAVKAVSYYKDPKREKSPAVRKLLVQVLGNIQSSAAVELMIDAALNDPNEDVRMEAIYILAEHKEFVAVRRFIERLRDNSNEVINRAGYALGQMNDTTAIGPLIEALVSTHVYVQTTGGGTSATFGSNGNNSFGSGTKTSVTRRTYQNGRVLDALRKISGTNFDYNVDQWRTWYATQNRTKPQDVRREK